MGKLNRNALATYLDYGFHPAVASAASASWEIIGDDIEEMSVELNPDVETRKNILGETKTIDNGYETTMDADPFYADPDKNLYAKIKDIAMNRKQNAECKTLMLEVIIADASASTHEAWATEVLVKPQSYGGGTEGLNFPFQVSEDGKRVKGTVTAASVKSGNPSFTAAS